MVDREGKGYDLELNSTLKIDESDGAIVIGHDGGDDGLVNCRVLKPVDRDGVDDFTATDAEANEIGQIPTPGAGARGGSGGRGGEGRVRTGSLVAIGNTPGPSIGPSTGITIGQTDEIVDLHPGKPAVMATGNANPSAAGRKTPNWKRDFGDEGADPGGRVDGENMSVLGVDEDVRRRLGDEMAELVVTEGGEVSERRRKRDIIVYIWSGIGFCVRPR